VDAASEVARALPVAGAGGGSWVAVLYEPASLNVAAWFVAGAAAIGVSACLRVLAAWTGEQHAMAVSDHVHARLHDKLLGVDLAFFDDNGDQNRLHLAQSQAMTRPVSVMNSLFQLTQGATGFLGVLVVLAGLHPLVALTLAMAGGPALLFRLRRGERLYEWRRNLAPLEREAGYFHGLLTGSERAKEMRMQGHGAYCRERFEAVRARLRDERRLWRRYVLSRELAMQLVMLTIAAALLLWITNRMLAGAITLGALVMYAQAVQRGQGQLGLLVGAVVDVYQSALFLQAFDELMDLPARVSAPAIPRALPLPIRRGIVLEGVEFTYPGADRPALRGVNLTLRPGECVGLVGANGAGKSTLAKLICRLYDPTAGRIMADGVDLRELDPVAWRRRLGALFQDFGCYQLTAAENIWIGDPRGTAADARVAAAAQRVGLDEVARMWPQGLATPLGRRLGEGTEPSAGQWQRLALARTLLRESELLILDEPTSALDPQTQDSVVRALRAATAGRMVLVISHRFEMLSWVDRVIVLGDGAVVEQGTVAALRAGHGEFARLFGAWSQGAA